MVFTVRLFLFLFAASALLAQRPAPIDNEFVRVVIAENTPGQKSRLHKHDQNRVMVHMSPGTMRLAFDNGPVNDVKFETGTVRWDPAGGMHTSENVGGTTYKIVEVELRKPGAAVAWPKLDPRKVAPRIYKLEFENPQVRVMRVRVRAGQAIPRHEHATHRVTIAMTPAKIRLTRADGSVAEAVYQAGEVRWGSPDTHAEKNDMKEPFELILIDIKGT
jgi:quercetin dioxygenase-like cupin family protein